MLLAFYESINLYKIYQVYTIELILWDYCISCIVFLLCLMIVMNQFWRSYVITWMVASGRSHCCRYSTVKQKIYNKRRLSFCTFKNRKFLDFDKYFCSRCHCMLKKYFVISSWLMIFFIISFLVSHIRKNI